MIITNLGLNMMEYIQLALTVIGGATVIFRFIAPYTETKLDDKIVFYLDKILRTIALNRNNNSVNIKVK